MCLKDVGQAKTLRRTGNQRVVARRNLKRTIGLAHDKRFRCRHTRNAGTALFDFTNVVGNGFFGNQRAHTVVNQHRGIAPFGIRFGCAKAVVDGVLPRRSTRNNRHNLGNFKLLELLIQIRNPTFDTRNNNGVYLRMVIKEF